MNHDTYLFAAQVSISSTTLLFSMFMLHKGKDAGVYLPMISGIVGYWLPSPHQNKIASGASSASSGGGGDIISSSSSSIIKEISS